ncbi:MAG: hypothetical protein NTW17_00020 [Candidatus Pacearchaeota archaeon]|nr:hypothetical protein [Candidatus Pacearchaeota archaeon]
MNYKMDVCRKSEELIKEMMEELGFIVIHYGYEYIFPNLANRKKLLKGRAGELVRGQPDFLIIDKETNKAYFIEVKFRKYGELDEKDISDFPETYIIMVSSEEIVIVDGEYRINHPDNEECFRFLTEIGPFRNKNKKIILKYVKKAREIFANQY